MVPRQDLAKVIIRRAHLCIWKFTNNLSRLLTSGNFFVLFQTQLMSLSPVYETEKVSGEEIIPFEPEIVEVSTEQRLVRVYLYM